MSSAAARCTWRATARSAAKITVTASSSSAASPTPRSAPARRARPLASPPPAGATTLSPEPRAPRAASSCRDDSDHYSRRCTVAVLSCRAVRVFLQSFCVVLIISREDRGLRRGSQESGRLAAPRGARPPSPRRTRPSARWTPSSPVRRTSPRPKRCASASPSPSAHSRVLGLAPHPIRGHAYTTPRLFFVSRVGARVLRFWKAALLLCAAFAVGAPRSATARV